MRKVYLDIKVTNSIDVQLEVCRISGVVKPDNDNLILVADGVRHKITGLGEAGNFKTQINTALDRANTMLRRSFTEDQPLSVAVDLSILATAYAMETPATAV